MLYWVYVVEFAPDEEQRRVYAIPNPMALVNGFMLDHHWMGYAEDLPSALPRVGCLLYQKDKLLGRIVEVDGDPSVVDKTTKLVLEREDGTRSTKTWRRTAHRVESE